MGDLHSLCQEAVSVAQGILVGFVRAEPGSANEVRYIFEGRVRVMELFEEPKSERAGSGVEGEDGKEGKL